MSKATCSVLGCERRHRARRLCDLHYTRWKSGRPIGGPDKQRVGRVPQQRGACSRPDCDRVVANLECQLCNAHHVRFIKGADMDAPIRGKKSGTPLPCPVEGCQKTQVRAGHCDHHAWRLRRWGHVYGGPPMALYRSRDAGNDYEIFVNGPYANRLVHRVIMEKLIGRALLRRENIHHKNGVRGDNRPENLELWVSHQPAGQRPEDLVAWALKILDRYSSGVAQVNGRAFSATPDRKGPHLP